MYRNSSAIHTNANTILTGAPQIVLCTAGIDDASQKNLTQKKCKS